MRRLCGRGHRLVSRAARARQLGATKVLIAQAGPNQPLPARLDPLLRVMGPVRRLRLRSYHEPDAIIHIVGHGRVRRRDPRTTASECLLKRQARPLGPACVDIERRGAEQAQKLVVAQVVGDDDHAAMVLDAISQAQIAKVFDLVELRLGRRRQFQHQRHIGTVPEGEQEGCEQVVWVLAQITEVEDTCVNQP